MECESAKKQQTSAEARAAKARRATEEGETEVESSLLAKRGTELHVTEEKETPPNTDTMISSEEQLDSSFSNEKDETFSAPLERFK